MKNQFYRTCRVYDDDTDKEFLAIFHRFEKQSELVLYTEDDGTNGYAVESRVIGIVERTDGQIMEVDHVCIRFVDGFAERISSKFRTEEVYDN